MLLLAPVAAGAAATVGLWWRDLAMAQLRTPSGALIAGGRMTGLLGAYLLMVQVGLMARVPWLERRIGSDWLARVHRWLGPSLVGLLVAHALLLVAGLAVIDHLSPLTESVTMVLTYPNLLMATVGLALLVAVGALSARAVRRLLRYETWHFLHLYAYLAGALAFTHQITAGADLGPDAAKLAWTAAHLLVAACVLRFRVWRPLAVAVRHRLRVLEVVREADGVLSIYVTGRHLDRLGVEAGQFFRWRFLYRGMWWQAHPFSLSAAPTPTMLRLTVKVVGDHTRSLQRLQPGVRVIAEGPYGAMTGEQRTRARAGPRRGLPGCLPLRASRDDVGRGPRAAAGWRAPAPGPRRAVRPVMRGATTLRILLAAVATVCAVVLVLGYRPLPLPRDRLVDRIAAAPPSRQVHGGHRCRAGGDARQRVAGPTTAWPLGHLRVRATLVGCRIDDVAVVGLETTNPVSRRRSIGALGRLRAEVLSEQCAGVDVVSGATYTSQAYLRSLQAVLDATHSGGACR